MIQSGGKNALHVRRSSKTWYLADDQVLRGPLVYLGLIELSPFPPHVHHRQFFRFDLHCIPNFYGIRATSDDQKLSRFNAECDLNPI